MVVRLATFFFLLLPTLHASPVPRIGSGFSGLFPPFSNQFGHLPSDNMIPPISPAHPGEWENWFCRSDYLPERTKYDFTLWTDINHLSVSSQQCQRPVIMKQAATVVLLMLSAAPMTSYNPQVTVPPDTGATGWTETQNHGRIGLAPDLPLWQQGRLITEFPSTSAHTSLTHTLTQSFFLLF